MGKDHFWKLTNADAGSPVNISIDDLYQHNYPSYYRINIVVSFNMIPVMIILFVIGMMEWIRLSYRGSKILLTTRCSEIGNDQDHLDLPSLGALVGLLMLLGFSSMSFRQ